MKLCDSLTGNSSILLRAKAGIWQEAVKFDMDLLVRADTTEPHYYQAALDGAEQFGPCFATASGLAMLHGRPERGVKKTGFTLMALRSLLMFNREDNDPVDILTAMAAVDASTRQEVNVTQIVDLFDDKVNFDHLRAYRTAQEVLDSIDSIIAAAV